MDKKDHLRFEYPDPTPIAIPIEGERFPNTLAELEAQARARQLLQAQMIPETFEEADDFDIEDDHPDYELTPWEIAADATTLTPDQLFQEVYGITREEANARLADLVKQSQQPSPLLDKQKNGGAPTE